MLIDNIIVILNELKAYTIEHFGDEEEYMESIRYEGLAAQKRAHEAFIDKASSFEERNECTYFKTA